MKTPTEAPAGAVPSQAGLGPQISRSESQIAQTGLPKADLPSLSPHQLRSQNFVPVLAPPVKNPLEA